jgi:phosphatidylglycerol lysyltransferase
MRAAVPAEATNRGAAVVDAPTVPDSAGRRLRWLGAAIPVAVLALAAYVLHRELSPQQVRDALDHARGIPGRELAIAAAFTGASYAVLTLYDFLALRYIRKPVGVGRTLLAAFVAYTFAHTLSFGVLTGAAVRYRFYGGSGLTLGDVARMTAFSSLTLATGFVLIAGVALAVAPAQVAAALPVDAQWTRAAGYVMVALVVGYLVLASMRGSTLRVGSWSLPMPGGALAFLQLPLGVVDLALSGAVLWSLLPQDVAIGFLPFAGIYVLATMAGVISHVPGGVGVFESVMLVLLPQVPEHQLVGSLIAYRAIYYILPLSIGGAIFIARELAMQRRGLLGLRRAAERYIGSIVPELSAAAVFVSAVVLLISGATPGIDSRLATVRHLFSLPVLELSHLAGSVIGVVLLILARALQKRVRAAWYITLWLLAGGVMVSLLKGFDFEEALFLSAVAGVLYLGRASFYRSSSLFQERFTPGWIVSVAAVLILVTCIGIITHRHVEYSSDLWWRFALHDDASRALRASFIAAMVAAVFFFSSLLGPPRRTITDEATFSEEKVRAALSHATTSLSQVVLAGDKRLLTSGSGDAFIMYQVARRSWVALGDPVGERCEHEDLVWRFHEMADRHAGWTVFYQVTGERLPLYVDLGLAPLKLGEEARVPLASFSLDGSARAELRQAQRRGIRSGATFEVVPPERLAPLLPTLAAISNAWLAGKATAEKRFSVGSFSEQYVSHFPVALVRCEGCPVAFANIWTTPTRDEVSVDLMRFGRDAPRGTMDFLFVELMLWAKAQGYRWFDLGMAPLSGLGTHRLAPAWHRLGNFVFRHGEHFYNFEGLRQYKAKFNPVWEPRYLVSPGGLVVPRVLTDISVLIAGGFRELVSK